MTKKERNNIIDLLKSEVEDDFKLATNIIEKLDTSFDELESICQESEKDSKFYYIPTRNKSILRVTGFWNKMDKIWKEKNLSI